MQSLPILGRLVLSRDCRPEMADVSGRTDNPGGTCDVSFEIEKAISESALTVSKLSATRKGAFSWTAGASLTISQS
jgi:hypothetical protein